MVRKRSRDAGTGRIVSAEEAKARPKETVTEEVGKLTLAQLDERLSIVEAVLASGGRLAQALTAEQNRRKRS